ncbi:MAG: tRNA lysidine(34) synthetase TilS [Oscillospiraceae bacterium]|nr:tRNA lysidine(34) synthetase TilS [Oscillospiraceae bacterium]
MTRQIEARVLEWVRRQGLITPDDRVLVALSGGADSVCLLRVLLYVQDILGLQVAAAHYNHRLRGDASEQDEQFVRACCRALAVPLTVGAGDVAEAARQSGQGIEETARTMRYAFLEEAAVELGADKIATAHHADDNVETVLLHLIRGASIRGLSGIPPCRGKVIRPLLCLERQEIEAYLTELGQGFVEDATNADITHRRNGLRHQVVPLLREQNPNLAATVLRQSGLLRKDSVYLDALAEEAFAALWEPDTLPVAGFITLEYAIAARVAALAVQAVGGTADQVHVWQIVEIATGDDPSAETMLPGGITVRRAYHRLVFDTTETEKSGGFASVTLPDSGSVTLSELGLTITVDEENVKKLKINQRFLFQRAAICGRITVRPRTEGDEIRLAGRIGTKSVKKWMIEEKIPAKDRSRWPIFVDEMGVIAIYGIGIAQRVAPNPGDEVKSISVNGGETWKKISNKYYTAQRPYKSES